MVHKRSRPGRYRGKHKSYTTDSLGRKYDEVHGQTGIEIRLSAGIPATDD
jgi:hypothetical protein